MEKRQLGNSTLAITPLMLGGNVLGWTADEATSFAVPVTRAVRARP
jgi:aryl-alcohol dehydrogenase-like predicted oxidoreductase